MQTSRTRALVLFSAIVAHKAFATLSLAARFIYRGAGWKALLFLMLPFHIMPPAALLIATGISGTSAAASMVLGGLACGTFLYVGAFEVVCEEFAEHARRANFAVGGGEAMSAEKGKGDGSPDSGDEAEVLEWRPTHAVKFALFCAGSGALMGISAAIPHTEGH